MERIIKLNEGTRMSVPLSIIVLRAPALSGCSLPFAFYYSDQVEPEGRKMPLTKLLDMVQSCAA